MRILIASEARFLRDPGGHVWSPDAAAYDTWARYLDVFDHVDVLARVSLTAVTPTTSLRADGLGVTFVDMPYYVGPAAYLGRAVQSFRCAEDAVKHAEAILLRGPGQIASITSRYLSNSRPYGVEVLGDPYDVFSPGAVDHPMRRLLRFWSPRQLKGIVRDATAVAFVTDEYLQRRYPSAPGAFSTSYSDQGYPDSMFIEAPRTIDLSHRALKLVTVASLEQMYKGIDVLLEAVAKCRMNGLDIGLNIVGDGKCRPKLEAMAHQLGIRNRVTFVGRLPSGDPVTRQLDKADVFVLPSRTEGLPRAIIEAMARGLPAIATTVGGIPELLDDAQLVPPDDIDALASKILEIAGNPDQLNRLSDRNLRLSHRFRAEAIQKKRSGLLQALRDQTEVWLPTARS